MSSRGWSPYATQYDPVKIASIDATDVIAHDHGVVRALSAVYRSKAPNGSKANLTLFVGRLHGDVTQEDLEKVCFIFSLAIVLFVLILIFGYSPSVIRSVWQLDQSDSNSRHCHRLL